MEVGGCDGKQTVVVKSLRYFSAVKLCIVLQVFSHMLNFVSNSIHTILNGSMKENELSGGL